MQVVRPGPAFATPRQCQRTPARSAVGWCAGSDSTASAGHDCRCCLKAAGNLGRATLGGGMRLMLNGKVMQDATTEDLAFDVPSENHAGVP